MPVYHKKKMEGLLLGMLSKAKMASLQVEQAAAEKKKKVLLEAAAWLAKKTAWILSQNEKDLGGAQAKGLTGAMMDRLTLTPQRIHEMAEGVASVARLKDPVGRVEASWKRPNGLKITKVIVPLGVILIIYESRPNVTVECASLCFKSGNAVILRGGSEAFHSNRALVSIFEQVFSRNKIPKAAVSLVHTTDRAAVDFLLTQEGAINLVIPRGGESLIRKVVERSKIPVIKHYQGICHVYVDKRADFEKARSIAYNAKMQRPGVCNAMETLLVHQDIAGRFLKLLGPDLRSGGCEVRGDRRTRKILPWAKLADAHDYGREFLDKILAVKTVPSLEGALEHIQKFGSGHTDAIVTEDPAAARIFKERVDSSSVMVNASTRFSDGFQYGFGAEIGISTDKIHARGPMGLEGLTSYKYIVEGKGHIRT